MLFCFIVLKYVIVWYLSMDLSEGSGGRKGAVPETGFFAGGREER